MTVNERELPTQDDILSCIEALRIKTEGWLSEIDESSENRAFPWAGRTQFGVIIFFVKAYALPYWRVKFSIKR